MYIDMQCSCGAAFQIQEGPETLTMLYAERFTSAHIVCGFMTNVSRDADEHPSYTVRKEKREKEY